MKWSGRVETKRIFVPIEEYTKNRKQKMIPVFLKKIVLRRGQDEITFGVSKRRGNLSISDSRETQTGFHGTQGFFGTREIASAGKKKSYSAMGWAEEVSRLIGVTEAFTLLREVGYTKDSSSENV